MGYLPYQLALAYIFPDIINYWGQHPVALAHYLVKVHGDMEDPPWISAGVQLVAPPRISILVKLWNSNFVHGLNVIFCTKKL